MNSGDSGARGSIPKHAGKKRRLALIGKVKLNREMCPWISCQKDILDGVSECVSVHLLLHHHLYLLCSHGHS